jgi:hypothetical protein
MKIPFLTPALVALVGLAFIGAPVTVRAQSTDTTTSAPAAATAPAPTTMTPSATTKHHKSGKTPYTGSITAIDATSLTVASTKRTLTLAISPTTKFATKEGKKLTAATEADFAVGDMVTGSYTTDATGAMTAYSVHKKKPMTTAAPAATPATPAAPAAQ